MEGITLNTGIQEFAINVLCFQENEIEFHYYSLCSWDFIILLFRMEGKKQPYGTFQYPSVDGQARQSTGMSAEGGQDLLWPVYSSLKGH